MNEESPLLLEVRGLRVEFDTSGGTLAAVADLDFHVARGEIVAIVGESGSGKSVTALSVMRLIEREGGRIARGAIRFHRESGVLDLTAADDGQLRRIRGNEIAMIFQEPMTSLNPVLTVGVQLAEVLVLHQGRSQADALREAEGLLTRVRIPDAARRLRQFPHELSGGMRQRVMIAMALACKPSLLIADEPTTALDVTVQAQILELIRTLQDETGMAVLFITHDMGIVAELADRVVVMKEGRGVEQAPIREIFARPQAAYTRQLLAAVPRLGGGSPAATPSAATPLVEVVDLVKRFPVRRGVLRRLTGHIHAVEGVSFSLGKGETLGLVGESGCGKSTTGRALMKLVEPTSGSIRLDGADITRLSRAEMRAHRGRMQMIFQDPYASLNPRLSVVESITEPMACNAEATRAERRERAATLLERVGLQRDHLDRYPHQFSGGQRQRLCIARALCLGPSLIVADEPVSALDVSIQAQVVELMRQLQDELGIAYLFISHDLAVVERVSHRVAVMYLGEIVEIGPTEAVLHDPRHPYTKRLLAAVPVPDPARRRDRVALDAGEIPSPMRPLGYVHRREPLRQVGQDHFARVA